MYCFRERVRAVFLADPAVGGHAQSPREDQDEQTRVHPQRQGRHHHYRQV